MSEDADIFEAAVRLVLEGDIVAATARLSTLAKDDPVKRPAMGHLMATDRDVAVKGSLTSSIRLQVWSSDHWSCRYCGRKLVHPGVLELLGNMCPTFPGLKAGHHMPNATTDPAVVRVYPAVDHVQAVSLGGSWRAIGNLVTACTPCNELKSNYLGWNVMERRNRTWNGLTEYYQPLLARTEAPRRYHLDWINVLELHRTKSRLESSDD